MLIQFQDYLSLNNIYLWTTFGVLPFWLMLIAFPNSKFTQFFINSIILPLILSSAYVYVIYQSYILNDSFFDIFKLYISIESLYMLFENEHILLSFWIHFIAINLFIGSWVSRDAFKYNISRKIVFFPLLTIYLTGPLGVVLYWLFRIFYAKRLGFHD
jgi:hypothetical protein